MLAKRVLTAAQAHTIPANDDVQTRLLVVATADALFMRAWVSGNAGFAEKEVWYNS